MKIIMIGVPNITSDGDIKVAVREFAKSINTDVHAKILKTEEFEVVTKTSKDLSPEELAEKIIKIAGTGTQSKVCNVILNLHNNHEIDKDMLEKLLKNKKVPSVFAEYDRVYLWNYLVNLYKTFYSYGKDIQG